VIVMAMGPATAPAEALEAAATGRLRYVSDRAPGIIRARSGRGFRYRAADGTRIQEPETLTRIRGLAIPPAWTDVWICPSPAGHIQAVGRDARGRKQYRYHPRWREVRDETKFARLVDFGRALPRIRRRVQRDLQAAGLPRDKVLATVVRLLETTLVRVGNEEYARQNGSYGLTTLRARHVRIEGSRLRLEFRGKGSTRHVVDVDDRRLARVVRQCHDLPGQELFQYVDESGRRQTIDSADVNGYLRAIAGREFTAKDFRTWAGTVLAATTLRALAADGPRRGKRIAQAVATVAEQLRNTPAICRRCYIHPAIIQAYQDAALGAPVSVVGRGRRVSRVGLEPAERLVLRLLERRGKRAARPPAARILAR
jgi:DNA topoisomerase-1